MTREGDKDLWQPEGGNPLASDAENKRVRALLEDELQTHYVPRAAREGGGANAWGRARGVFAERWVSLAQQLGLKAPGDPRTPLAEGETRQERREDAARTRLRQFLEGHREQAWVLCGIEATICDRRGMALPPCAYQTQERLDV